VPVTFEIEVAQGEEEDEDYTPTSVTSFHDNTILVQLNDGRKIQASELSVGDVFKIRSGPGALAWATVATVPEVV